MKRRLIVMAFLVAGLLAPIFPTNSFAQDATSRGLVISPPRQFIEVAAGESTSSEVTIANFTDSSLNVDLSVEEFSVADYSYDYVFSDTKDAWLRFNQTAVELAPGENKKIAYSVQPPMATPPGGKYYTIVAGATIKQGSISSRVQVAAPLYITIKGTVDTTNTLVSASITTFTVGDKIPFTMDVTNTGNIHYPITIIGSLSGIFTSTSTVSSTHILLPDSTRRFISAIPTPILPGIYKATYGYTTDSSPPIMKDEYIVYTPLWFFAAIILIGLVLQRVIYRRREKTTVTSTDSQQ